MELLKKLGVGKKKTNSLNENDFYHIPSSESPKNSLIQKENKRDSISDTSSLPYDPLLNNSDQGVENPNRFSTTTTSNTTTGSPKSPPPKSTSTTTTSTTTQNIKDVSSIVPEIIPTSNPKKHRVI